ncbi:putative ribonuclease H-like domain-containing protein [Tanacetum coccineum]|uniref:Ribonuclease H-like domain-containing protein n=1 Tax=Tanacetum coccineum TaxID=301880 RepID=A0ABQ4ZKV2_9ASTR
MLQKKDCWVMINQSKSKVECFNCHKIGHFARECRAPRSKDRNWNQGSSSKAVRIEDASKKAMCAIDGAGFDWSDMAEDEIQANMALMAFTDSEVSNDKSCSKSCLQNYEALKKQYDDLLVKLDDTGFKAATYKRGLSILEAQVVKYKESEVLFSEEIALLKRSVGHKEYLMGLLRTELEKVKEEKEGFEFKIAKFEKSSKDLDQLLASQITDKSKKGFGYNVVPSPHPLILNRPTPLDLSYSGLEEFKQPEINENSSRDSSLKPTTICDKESDNSKKNTDDSLKQQHKTATETSSVKEEEPKKARENNDAPIIEDWVSDDEEEVEPIPKVEKKTAIPTATKKESVKPEKPIRRSISCPNAHKHMVPRAVLMKTGLKTVNNSRPSYTVHQKSTVPCARPKTHFQNQAQSTVQRPFYKKTTLTKRSNNQNINTGRQTVNTVRPNVNTVRARGFNAVKPSACWVWRPIKPNGASLSNSQLNDKGFVDSGCSRHMSGNIAHLSDFKDFDGGYVTFGGGANGGRITGKVAKATSEESMLWHRRLGHVNFKNINKLVKENLHRTPQQNGVAERKNRTLIEAARTMLDTLGKFNEKSDEGFFVGYSLSSKAFRVYNIRTRKVQENLHVGFLENKPMIEGNGPKWLFDLDSLTQSMNYVPVVAGTFSNDFAGIQGVSESSTSSQQDQDNQDCIVMPIWKDASYFDDASPRSVADAQLQDQNGTHDDCSLQNNGTADQQVNTASPEVNTGSREVSTAVPEVNTATPEDLMGPIPTSEDTQVEDQEIELGNISPSYAVSSTPHTRIHKDHPIDHVIGDVQSSVQTRRMTTSYSELGFLGAIYEGKTHQDLHTCLFACFLSQEEPKRVSKALSDPAGGTPTVQTAKCMGHTQEEGIDYDEVFAPVARIEAIRIFLAYASYMGFTVYQMDVKSAFLYGQIEEEELDDIIFGSTKKELCDEFEKLMKDNQIYCPCNVEKFNFSDVKSASTPTDLEKPLVKDGDADDVDEHLYRSMIGSLMYLTASRPDIMFAVCACARSLVLIKDSPLELVSELIVAMRELHLIESNTRVFWEGSLDPKPTAGLWLADQDGITSIPNSEIFEQLALMGYHTDSDKIGVLEADLMKTKKTYSSAYTKLILRVKKLESQIKIRKARRQARVVLSDDEVFEDDSSKQGRKLSDAEVQEKASTDTKLFIQEVTPTEVIQDQEGSEKASDEVSTAGAKKGTASEEVPIVSTAEVSLSTAGGTVTYTRRSAEKRSRQDKGKAIMIEEEPKKKSKKELEQERLTEKKSIPRKSIRKRQKMEEDTEKEELKGFLDIIPREEVPIEVESLFTKFPVVDWKTCVLTENFMYYQVFRGDGSSKNYKVWSKMLEDFDRLDGDLHTLFEPDEDDEIWKDQFIDLKCRSERFVLKRNNQQRGRRLEDFIQKKLVDLKDNHKFRGGLLGINLHKT